jgi:hypothetical protein
MQVLSVQPEERRVNDELTGVALPAVISGPLIPPSVPEPSNHPGNGKPAPSWPLTQQPSVSAESTPRLHQLPAALEKIGAHVGRVSRVAD